MRSRLALRYSTRSWVGSADTREGQKHMARLVLSLDSQVMAEYNMNKERYTIGRLPDNDIRIDNAAVSGHHSLIINILNDSFLEDLNSTNGTYVNGKLIKKHALQHGDVITVGHHQLRFVEDDEQQDEFEKTMVIQPSARPVERVRAAAEAAEQVGGSLTGTARTRALADGAAALKKAKLQVLSGAFAGREVELNKALTTLRRADVHPAKLRHVHRQHVHRHPAGERCAPTVHQHRRTGGETAVHAIPVTARDDRNHRIARRDPGAAVADALAARHAPHGDHRALERHHGLQAQVGRRTVGKR